MSKQESNFQEFLSNIEPSTEQVAFAKQAHIPLREYLSNDTTFKSCFRNSFLYGSYRRHTAIGDIKDIDIVIINELDPTSSDNSPDKVLKRLKASLDNYYEAAADTSYQRRSIRVNDPLPEKSNCIMTLDILPAIAPNGENQPLLIPDRELQKWISSNPKGHIQCISEKNEECNGALVPLIKIMKWWWKYQCSLKQPEVLRPKPKGFWVELLTSIAINPANTYYADHFISVLESITLRYPERNFVPELPDLGLPGHSISTNMTIKEFNVFQDCVAESLVLAKKARLEASESKSNVLWRILFGEDMFPAYKEQFSIDDGHKLQLGDSSHKIDPPWAEIKNTKCEVRIRGVLCQPNGKYLRKLFNDGEELPPEMLIKFHAEVSNFKGGEIFWQVVNTGRHAATSNALRGDEYFYGKTQDRSTSPDPKHNYETTKYTGKHWIQCFIVKDGALIAKSEPFFVNVYDPAYPD